jgi:predicted phosphodiesterase
MFRRCIQFLFRKPLLWILSKFNGKPDVSKIQSKLSSLLKQIMSGDKSLGLKLTINTSEDKFIIMSDLHKGSGNDADDFTQAQNNYVAACYYYLQNDFTYIALGDIEELWKNNIVQVVANNENTIELERKFIEKDKFIKVIGNHDLYWRNTPFFANKWLKKMYGKCIDVHEGVVLSTKINESNLTIFLTHGHQGDKTSDGNKFSKWFVANIWSKVQDYLDININSPSKDFLLRDKHNRMMYDWSAMQKNTILITGHTHKPVFASTNHMEKLNKDLLIAKSKNDIILTENLTLEITKKQQEYIITEAFSLKKPSYFNTGCCCFADGDITIIEIENNTIKLVKWGETSGESNRYILQELNFNDIVNVLN